MNDITIGFAGLSHLGIVSAAAAAEKGFTVIGWDPDDTLAADVAAGRLPINEPGLPELLRTNGHQLRFTSDPAALGACDVVYLSRDVPTDEHGNSDLGPVDVLWSQILASTGPETTLVVLSQVAPGFTRTHAVEGRKVCYQVETLVFGQAVGRALKPERFIVGCADPAQPLAGKFADFLKAFDCPVLAMGYESAELAKIAINCCLVAMVSTANTLAELCEHIGADWNEIIPALRLDRRIGPYSYLVSGLGIAGGNLERDLATVVQMADIHGTDAKVVSSWIDNSRHRKEWPVTALKQRLGDRAATATIGLLGLAYKIDTASVKNSPAVNLIEKFPGTTFRAHDPAVPSSVVSGVVRVESPIEACRDADAVAVMTPWSNYRSIAPADLASVMKGRLLLDPFQVFQPNAVRNAGLIHVVLGRPSQ